LTIGSLLVGASDIDAPISDLRNCDVFDIGHKVKERTYREMVAYLAANHVRIRGRRVECSIPVSQEPVPISHAMIPGGVLGAYLVTYRGPDFLHSWFPQSLLQTLFVAMNEGTSMETVARSEVTNFNILVDEVYHETEPSVQSLPAYAGTEKRQDPVIHLLRLFLGRPTQCDLIGPVYRRLQSIMLWHLSRKRITSKDWNIDPYQRNSMTRGLPHLTAFNFLAMWDDRDFKDKWSAQMGKQHAVKLIISSGELAQSMAGNPKCDLINVLTLMRDDGKSRVWNSESRFLNYSTEIRYSETNRESVKAYVKRNVSVKTRAERDAISTLVACHRCKRVVHAPAALLEKGSMVCRSCSPYAEAQ